MVSLCFAVFKIVRSFLRILSSLIMMVFLSLSSPLIRFSFSASSVKLMYAALSFLLSSRARVVFPTQGVPVMRMTRLFITVNALQGIFICSARLCLAFTVYLI